MTGVDDLAELCVNGGVITAVNLNDMVLIGYILY